MYSFCFFLASLFVNRSKIFDKERERKKFFKCFESGKLHCRVCGWRDLSVSCQWRLYSTRSPRGERADASIEKSRAAHPFHDTELDSNFCGHGRKHTTWYQSCKHNCCGNFSHILSSWAWYHGTQHRTVCASRTDTGSTGAFTQDILTPHIWHEKAIRKSPSARFGEDGGSLAGECRATRAQMNMATLIRPARQMATGSVIRTIFSGCNAAAADAPEPLSRPKGGNREGEKC
jgi:hypothetical protein